MRTQDVMFPVDTEDFVNLLQKSKYINFADECKKLLGKKIMSLYDIFQKTAKIFPYNAPGFEKEFIYFVRDNLKTNHEITALDINCETDYTNDEKFPE